MYNKRYLNDKNLPFNGITYLRKNTPSQRYSLQMINNYSQVSSRKERKREREREGERERLSHGFLYPV